MTSRFQIYVAKRFRLGYSQSWAGILSFVSPPQASWNLFWEIWDDFLVREEKQKKRVALNKMKSQAALF